MKLIVISFLWFLISVVVFISSFFVSDSLKNVMLVSSFCSACLSLLILLISFDRKNKSKVKWYEQQLEVWNDTSYKMNQAGSEVFNELPMGILVYDKDLYIRWSNKYLKQIFKSNLNDKLVREINEQLYDIVLNKKANETIVISDLSFDVINSSISSTLYFFDQTTREEIKQTYKDNTCCIGKISIDNLEISLRRLDIQEQNVIRGEILGEITEYINEHKSYIQSVSNDDLVIVSTKERLEEMIKDKFVILDTVRELSMKNHLKTSISVGFACYDVDKESLGNLAQSAVDLAVKRGGDQVVCNIEGEKIQFFGGRTNALEKNSLVESRLQAQNLKEMIETASNVVITTHDYADSDAFSSCIAMYDIASLYNKDVSVLFELEKADSTVTKLYNIIQEEGYSLVDKLVNENTVSIKPNTLVILLDTQSQGLAMYPSVVDEALNLYVIDHHRHGEASFNNAKFVYVETSSSSTCELIVDMFGFFEKIKIHSSVATSLLVGLVVDTNNFTYRTGIRTFEVASVLKSLGGDMIKVREILRDDLELEQQIASALLNVEIVLDNIAIVRLPSDKLNYERHILAKISDKLLEIDKVSASFTIGHVSDLTSSVISARSYDDINVQMIMERLGGGGHLNSAACQLPDTSIAESYEKLIEIIKQEYDYGDERMKVILTADVKGKGKKSAIIEVANGYANYLFTNNLAKPATKENIDELKVLEQEKVTAEMNQKNMMVKIKEEIEQKSINMYIKLGNDGKSFGQITTKHIADEFELQRGIKLDKRKISLLADINSVGIYTAKVDLHKEVVASITINVLEK